MATGLHPPERPQSSAGQPRGFAGAVATLLPATSPIAVMPAFIFRTVHRDPDGMLGPTFYEQTIEAPTAEAAIADARAINLDMTALRANAVYITTIDDGRAIWSLHTGSR